jgi:nucleoside-diphosphate-sugar epimerase
MRVLLAGGAGFIGSHIADALLARGDEVVAVDILLLTAYLSYLLRLIYLECYLELF